MTPHSRKTWSGAAGHLPDGKVREQQPPLALDVAAPKIAAVVRAVGHAKIAAGGGAGGDRGGCPGRRAVWQDGGLRIDNRSALEVEPKPFHLLPVAASVLLIIVLVVIIIVVIIKLSSSPSSSSCSSSPSWLHAPCLARKDRVTQPRAASTPSTRP